MHQLHPRVVEARPVPRHIPSVDRRDKRTHHPTGSEVDQFLGLYDFDGNALYTTARSVQARSAAFFRCRFSADYTIITSGIRFGAGQEIAEGKLDGTDLVLGLNIRGDGRQDVVRYIKSTGQIPNAFAFLSPPSQGAQSIGGAEDAVAMAQAVRERLGNILKAQATADDPALLLWAIRALGFFGAAVDVNRPGSIIRVPGPRLRPQLHNSNVNCWRRVRFRGHVSRCDLSGH